ncbi:hypothetical protein [Chryseobacterium sp. 2987]|uniref:hypothetical protein n=1 Tax=Chryseobacterium sp. 2987 TaxID=2817767 RepID=UPI00285C25AE|nr:hypothetical protein [Chryseobacterium sp. 2987]MDR6919542.1 hypothetical protein [Chryseobacterium sp. 2987]
MKSLKEMDNIDRAYLFAKLFPDELRDITEFIKTVADEYYKNEDFVRSIWTGNPIDIDPWYDLVGNFRHRYTANGTRLYKNCQVFTDQLFDGLDALFTIDALLNYTTQARCGDELRQAIHLFFGKHKPVLVNLKLF